MLKSKELWIGIAIGWLVLPVVIRTTTGLVKK